MNNIGVLTGSILLVIVFVFLLLVGPFILITGLNLLLGMTIPFTLETWVGAMLVIFVLIDGNSTSSKAK